MKFSIFYKLFALAFLAFVFQSRSGGPANVQGLQVSGAPGNGTCANSGCHTAGQFDPALSIELLDDGTAVDKYEPGKTYTVRVTVSAGSGTPNGYGFQATSRTAANTAAGTFSAGVGQQVTPVGANAYLEHSDIANSGVFESAWTAPLANTGAVTFYAAGIAANGNGGSSGDGHAQGNLSIEEDDASSTSFAERAYATMDIAPNPVVDEMKLKIISRSSGNFDLRIADVSGKIIRTEAIFLNSGQNEKTFSIGDLESGYYVVQLRGDSHVTSAQLLKL